MNRLFTLLSATLVYGGCSAQPVVALDSETGSQLRFLESFYVALTELEAHRRERVSVLQIGDSHTANDAFSGRMRELMQARFGDGGRGVLPPGIPYRYYKPAKVHVTSEAWTPYRSSIDGFGAFGWAGLQQRSSAGAIMTLEAEAPGLTKVEIGVLGQPGGGALRVTTSEGEVETFSTERARPGLLQLQLRPGPFASAVRLQARGDGPVSLLFWSAERAEAGVTWSNLGTIGATVDLVQHWDPVLMAAEAAAIRPDLVILAFGTNEGFRDATDLAFYPIQYGTVLQSLRRAAPWAALLAAGPPGGVLAVQGEGDCLAKGRSGWAVPRNLPRIREIERAVAAQQGVAFWDWADAMGGDCMIIPWAEADPPLAASDHVHLLKPGYVQTADAFFATLMNGYDRYRRNH